MQLGTRRVWLRPIGGLSFAAASFALVAEPVGASTITHLSVAPVVTSAGVRLVPTSEPAVTASNGSTILVYSYPGGFTAEVMATGTASTSTSGSFMSPQMICVPNHG